MSAFLVVGEFGKNIVITFKEDGAVKPIDTATTMYIRATKYPGGLTTQYVASFVTDGTDGKIKYLLQSGDVDAAGYWEVRGVASAASFSWKTKAGRIDVFDAP